MTVETSRQLSRRTVWVGRLRSQSNSTNDYSHLDTLRVHLVVLFRFRPEETGVTLLVDQQVREVDLLEL